MRASVLLVSISHPLCAYKKGAPGGAPDGAWSTATLDYGPTTVHSSDTGVERAIMVATWVLQFCTSSTWGVVPA